MSQATLRIFPIWSVAYLLAKGCSPRVNRPGFPGGSIP